MYTHLPTYQPPYPKDVLRSPDPQAFFFVFDLLIEEDQTFAKLGASLAMIHAMMTRQQYDALMKKLPMASTDPKKFLTDVLCVVYRVEKAEALPQAATEAFAQFLSKTTDAALFRAADHLARYLLIFGPQHLVSGHSAFSQRLGLLREAMLAWLGTFPAENPPEEQAVRDQLWVLVPQFFPEHFPHLAGGKQGASVPLSLKDTVVTGVDLSGLVSTTTEPPTPSGGESVGPPMLEDGLSLPTGIRGEADGDIPVEDKPSDMDFQIGQRAPFVPEPQGADGGAGGAGYGGRRDEPLGAARSVVVSEDKSAAQDEGWLEESDDLASADGLEHDEDEALWERGSEVDADETGEASKIAPAPAFADDEAEMPEEPARRSAPKPKPAAKKSEVPEEPQPFDPFALDVVRFGAPPTPSKDASSSLPRGGLAPVPRSFESDAKAPSAPDKDAAPYPVEESESAKRPSPTTGAFPSFEPPASSPVPMGGIPPAVSAPPVPPRAPAPAPMKPSAPPAPMGPPPPLSSSLAPPAPPMPSGYAQQAPFSTSDKRPSPPPPPPPSYAPSMPSLEDEEAGWEDADSSIANEAKAPMLPGAIPPPARSGGAVPSSGKGASSSESAGESAPLDLAPSPKTAGGRLERQRSQLSVAKDRKTLEEERFKEPKEGSKEDKEARFEEEEKAKRKKVADKREERDAEKKQAAPSFDEEVRREIAVERTPAKQAKADMDRVAEQEETLAEQEETLAEQEETLVLEEAQEQRAPASKVTSEREISDDVIPAPPQEQASPPLEPPAPSLEQAAPSMGQPAPSMPPPPPLVQPEPFGREVFPQQAPAAPMAPARSKSAFSFLGRIVSTILMLPLLVLAAPFAALYWVGKQIKRGVGWLFSRSRAALERKAQEKGIKVFELFLSEEATKPGPIERTIAQSKMLLRVAAAFFGLWTVGLLCFVDAMLSVFTQYAHKLLGFWKTLKSKGKTFLRKRNRTLHQGMAEDLMKVRLQLSQLLLMPGFSPQRCAEALSKEELKELLTSPTFPLHQVLDARCRLDEVKGDIGGLSGFHFQTFLKKAMKGGVLQLGEKILDVFKHIVPNPFLFLRGWKDLYVMWRYMRYSRREILEMYVRLVDDFQTLLAMSLESANTKDAEKDLAPETIEPVLMALFPHEEAVFARLGLQRNSLLQKSEMNQRLAVEATQRDMQRLLQTLCLAGRFLLPQRWSRAELLLEYQAMATADRFSPQIALEVETWLDREVKQIIESTKILPSHQEFEAQLEEQTLRKKRQRILRKIINQRGFWV